MIVYKIIIIILKNNPIKYQQNWFCRSTLQFLLYIKFAKSKFLKCFLFQFRIIYITFDFLNKNYLKFIMYILI